MLDVIGGVGRGEGGGMSSARAEPGCSASGQAPCCAVDRVRRREYAIVDSVP